MTKKRSSPSGSKALTNLAVSRTEAESKISARIEDGKELLDSPILSSANLAQAKDKYSKWNEFNAELLKRLFTSSEVSEKYSEYCGVLVSSYEFKVPGFEGEVEDYHDNVKQKITYLESIKDKLSLYDEPSQPLPKKKEQPPGAISNQVFIVHGHDEASKEAVARFLEKLELRAVILHERPDKGRTIIEKFEDYSSVAYAVVLLTPDDIGALLHPAPAVGHRQTIASERYKASSRARQNVIFELGYFIGKLGRGRVCALYKEGVERPSDLHGVLYVPLDKEEAWRLKLARELKAAGLNIDLNKAAET